MSSDHISVAIKKFQSGKTPTEQEIKFLSTAALENPKIANLVEKLSNNSLLHWCAKLDLLSSTNMLLQVNANAAAFNDAGQQAYQLTKNVTHKTVLAAAAGV